MNKIYFALILLCLFQAPILTMEESKEENTTQINKEKGKTEQIILKHVKVKILIPLLLESVSNYLNISCDEESNAIIIEGEEKTVDIAVDYIKEHIDVLPDQPGEILHVYD